MTVNEVFDIINELVFWDAKSYPEGYAETAVLKLINQAKAEWERNRTLHVLEEYNKWLLKKGYTDTDIICELDVNDFLKEFNKL